MSRNKARVLVYGFGPFKQYKDNITQEIIATLALNREQEALILPVKFDSTSFSSAFESFEPDYILGLGQYPRGQRIRIERKIFNLKKDSTQNLDSPIDYGWDTDYVNWKIQAQKGLSRVTYDAGRYVCNFSMAMGMAYAKRYKKKYAFLHIPRTFSVPQAQAFILSVLP